MEWVCRSVVAGVDAGGSATAPTARRRETVHAAHVGAVNAWARKPPAAARRIFEEFFARRKILHAVFLEKFPKFGNFKNPTSEGKSKKPPPKRGGVRSIGTHRSAAEGQRGLNLVIAVVRPRANNLDYLFFFENLIDEPMLQIYSS